METNLEKPNGPLAAALLAGGLGCAALGVITFISQKTPTSAFTRMLVWVKPVGSLSGKSSLAIIIFLVTWLILGLVWKRKEMPFNKIAFISFVLLAIGLLGTFPPVWHLF